jgi:hypothetical protein
MYDDPLVIWSTADHVAVIWQLVQSPDREDNHLSKKKEKKGEKAKKQYISETWSGFC